MNNKVRNLSLDELQMYVAKGAILHPVMYTQYIELLQNLEYHGKVTLIPSFRLEKYSNEMAARIAAG
jgi:hypothetical protein